MGQSVELKREGAAVSEWLNAINSNRRIHFMNKIVARFFFSGKG
jgi:hypothetical protein